MVRNETTEKIKVELKKIHQSLGLSAPLDAVEVGALALHLKDFYGTLELWELSRAIDLGISGRFNCETGGALSKKLLSGVLNAYRDWKRSQPSQPTPEQIAIASALLNERALYDNDRDGWWKYCIIQAFERFKQRYIHDKTKEIKPDETRVIRPTTLNNQYIDWLWSKDIQTNATSKSYQFYKDIAMAQMREEKKVERNQNANSIKIYIDALDKSTGPEGRAKRLMLIDWFTELVEFDMHISELLPA